MRKISQKMEMTFVTLTLTPQGHWGMLTLIIPFLRMAPKNIPVRLALSYQNCRESSRKCVKSAKNGNDLCDLKVNGAC